MPCRASIDCQHCCRSRHVVHCCCAQVLAVPEPFTPMVSLSEEDPLSAAPTYFPMDGGGLLSDLGAYEEGMAVGLPPRVVDGALLKCMKLVGRAACRPLHLWGAASLLQCCLGLASRPACTTAAAPAPVPDLTTSSALEHRIFCCPPPRLQSDFVGYIQNPHFLRGAPYGAATHAAAAQRNQRVQPQPDSQDQGECGSGGR